MTPRKPEPNSLAYPATDATGRGPTGPGERFGYWDAWKGLAILAVVALHATDQSLTFRVGSLNWWFGLTVCQLLDFAVPLFLAIAGYFAGQSTTSTAAEFYGKRIVRILPPYLFWTLVAVLLVRRPDLQSPRALFDDLVLGQGIGIGYFVIVLLQYVLITPLLRKLTSTRSHLLAMVAISVASLAWNYAVDMACWCQEGERFSSHRRM